MLDPSAPGAPGAGERSGDLAPGIGDGAPSTALLACGRLVASGRSGDGALADSGAQRARPDGYGLAVEG